MFQDKVKSLDSSLPGADSEDFSTLADTLASNENIECDVVEKVAQEQLKDELWDRVSQILQDDRKVQILMFKYINNMSLREIGKQINVTAPAVEEMLKRSVRLIKRNAGIRQLAIETGIWDTDKPFSADTVKLWCKYGNYNSLDKRELKYARRMGWVDEEQLQA